MTNKAYVISEDGVEEIDREELAKAEAALDLVLAEYKTVVSHFRGLVRDMRQRRLTAAKANARSDQAFLRTFEVGIPPIDEREYHLAQVAAMDAKEAATKAKTACDSLAVEISETANRAQHLMQLIFSCPIT